MAEFYVYVHRRADSGAPFYVGKGKGDRASRSTGRNRHWQNVVRKAGGFEFEFFVRDIEEELAFLVEVELIDRLRRAGLKLANATDGGEGVSGFTRVPSAEENARRAASNRGKKRTPEQCARIAEAKRGHGVGRKQSAETIDKRMAALRGRPRPDVAGYLGGRKRPLHVVEALRRSNDERYAARRSVLAAAIVANPGLSLAALARLTGCDRETVAKYKRAAQES